ncbi:uncharacterized protein LOC133828616 [Humulus lupulus]|uniref:uncharacterized protein LOC133828616 n=1 Tax=Humulus lupulus TaxID=3486 RepID=UPI002B4077C0|nr:uncharacterized protein LOC133828616 [Humulus lupulus]
MPSTHDTLNDAKKKKVHEGLKSKQQKKHRCDSEPKCAPYTFYTDLTDAREHIFLTNENQVSLKRPPPMKNDWSQRDPSKYCQYHKDGHTMAECTHLKIEIEELIWRGHMGMYVRRGNPIPEERTALPRAQERAPKILGEVRTIFGGLGFGGDSRNGRDRYAREARKSPPFCIMSLEQRPPTNFKGENDSITFTEEDTWDMYFPHKNPLVLTIELVNMRIYQVLVDNGSSVDIIYCLALEKMGFDIRNQKPCNTSLYGFTGDSVQPLGTIKLALTLEEQPRKTTVMSNFVVVDCASIFNAILRRPSIRESKVVTFVYHPAVKLPTV